MSRAASPGSPAWSRLLRLRRQHDAARGVVVDAAEDDQATVDRSQGVHDVRDRRSRLALLAHALDEALEVAGRDVGHPPATEIRQRMKFERLLVAADGGRLVGLAAARRDRSVLHAGEVLVGRVAQRDARGAREPRARLCGEELGAPILGFAQRGESLSPALAALAEPTTASKLGEQEQRLPDAWRTRANDARRCQSAAFGSASAASLPCTLTSTGRVSGSGGCTVRNPSVPREDTRLPRDVAAHCIECVYLKD